MRRLLFSDLADRDRNIVLFPGVRPPARRVVLDKSGTLIWFRRWLIVSVGLVNCPRLVSAAPVLPIGNTSVRGLMTALGEFDSSTFEREVPIAGTRGIEPGKGSATIGAEKTTGLIVDTWEEAEQSNIGTRASTEVPRNNERRVLNLVPLGVCTLSICY